ncbi:MAG: helix-turn-helix transcriptional regulator [Cognatishimia activa]
MYGRYKFDVDHAQLEGIGESLSQSGVHPEHIETLALISAADLSRIFGVSRVTIYQWHKDRRLPRPVLGEHHGRRYRYSEIRALLDMRDPEEQQRFIAATYEETEA